MVIHWFTVYSDLLFKLWTIYMFITNLWTLIYWKNLERIQRSNVKHHTPPPKLYSLWFIPTGARTHDLPHSRRARKPLHLDAVKLRYNPNHKLCMVIHYKRWIRSKFFQYIRVQRFVINIYIVHSLNSRSLYNV
jgi:hypothetical protein